ncbi:hypothetical protein TNIN_468041 [Trichonephila inaurata madagascariensis]|uniref:Uncharacterized protein n=1 Tax=Trichonephila inaurata madagascariensis TaxID=2747483 RepID=A0A8X6M9S6_9ARAC|nr:hypothetical protein TNIN_468041 [Trichonephila inaurata madagascariensis]
MIMANSYGVETSSVLFKRQMLFANECVEQIFLYFGIELKSDYPEGVTDHYFSDSILVIVLKTMRNAQDLIIDQYNGWFKTGDRTLNFNNFKQLIDFITYLSCNAPYSHESLIELLAFASNIAVKAYLDGVPEAPDYAVKCITYALAAFKFDSYRSDSLINFSEDYKKGLFH